MLNPNFDKCLLFGFCYSHYFPNQEFPVFNSFVVPNVSPRANINLYFLTDFARWHHTPPLPVRLGQFAEAVRCYTKGLSGQF